jgi:hypothetical protein
MPGLARKLLGFSGKHLRDYSPLEKRSAETFITGFFVYTLAEAEAAVEKE